MPLRRWAKPHLARCGSSSATATTLGLSVLWLAAATAHAQPNPAVALPESTPRAAVWEGAELRLREPIAFRVAHADILPASDIVLDAIAERMRERPGARFEIAAHTDPAWHCHHCGQDRSLARARAVRRALIERGVAPERLVARSYGGTRPLQECSTVPRRRRWRCQRRNLRIEIRVD